MSRRTGLVGAAVGLLTVGAAAGLAAERYLVGRDRSRPDPEADEPFFRLPSDRTLTVRADDGVQLHVEIVEGPDDGPTVVFLHGYTHQLALWHYQRKALAEDPPGRLVFYDHRAHGRSSRGPWEHSTIDQLGRDLACVLDAAAPTGEVVLVGHSMGGMTIMALADLHPELFGLRVVGVALVATSAGHLAELTFGLPAALLPVTKRVLPVLTKVARRAPAPLERGRRVGTDLAFLLMRHGGFGDGEVAPSVVEFAEQMVAATPVDVVAEFYDTFLTHDKLAAIEVLHACEVLILVGADDLLTPEEHSRAMAEFLPAAELVVLEGAGHMVLLEQPAEVTGALQRLLARAGSSSPQHDPEATGRARLPSDGRPGAGLRMSARDGAP